MSVLLNFTIFPTDKGESVSNYVSTVVERIRAIGFPNQLTAMGTLVETETLSQALSVVEEAYAMLEKDCNRVYITASIDIRRDAANRMVGKVKSVEQMIGNRK